MCFFDKIIKKKDNVWNKTYDDTICENEKLFEVLIAFLKEKYAHLKIEVLVMPFNPIFRISNRKQIEKSKKTFYLVMKKLNVDVIDHFSEIKTSIYFDDHCHLNSKGARRYTKYLLQKIALF